MPDRPRPVVYFLSLEAIRGVAAAAIVLYHLNDQLGYPFVFNNFYLGVDLFFVLSGFIIFHTYGGKIEDRAGFGRFLWLRFARVYPLHFITLLAFVVFQIAVMASNGPLVTPVAPLFSHNDGWSFAANLLLVQALHLFSGPSFNIPSWSISTEFYTYVVFGALLWLGLIRPHRPFLVPCLLAVVAYAMLAAVTPSIHVMHDWGFVRNVLGFALGIIARGLYGLLPAPTTRMLTGLQLGAAAALLAVMAVPVHRVPYADFTAPVLFAVLIIVCSYDRGGFCPILLWAPLQWLGRISYSLYLTHYMIVLAITGYYTSAVHAGQLHGGKWMTWSLIPLTLAVTTAVAHVTCRFWELPARSFLRARWSRPRPVMPRAEA